MHNVEIRKEIVDRVLARRRRYHLFDRLDPRRTALVVIDMQSAFVEPGSPAEVPAARGIIGAINALAGEIRRLGGTVKVPTLDGDEAVSIPEGTQSGASFKLRSRGMPNVSGRGRGDLHVSVKVAVPKKLSKEQKQLLEQLRKTLPQDVEIEEEKPFFERVKDIFG